MKAYLRKLANDLMFDLSDEELADLEKEFDQIKDQMALFETIDTEGVEPMVYPFEMPTTFLREDVPGECLTVEQALVNASESSLGHFHVPKVVK